MSRQVVLDFPGELPELEDKEVLKKGKEAIILEFLRKKKISQGKAAELLEIDRYTLSDLMAKYNIPMVDITSEELKSELKQAKKFFRGK